jgi:hypothetical protein
MSVPLFRILLILEEVMNAILTWEPFCCYLFRVCLSWEEYYEIEPLCM